MRSYHGLIVLIFKVSDCLAKTIAHVKYEHNPVGYAVRIKISPSILTLTIKWNREFFMNYRESTHIIPVLADDGGGGGGCNAVDKKPTSSCAGWKAKGYCTLTYVKYMQDNCKKTCTC